ncbi:unnamed protein product [marine sediment metagenome]|uniref:DUF3467 domain-containing protein n=1 Tax=marine sediment metagenome TaxID=412755 RepID=X0WXJ8_9ZZZZ
MENFSTIYVNAVIINNTKNEFIMDYIFAMSESDKNNILSRIIQSPEHTKRINNLLTKMIKDYEEKYGEIKIEEKEEKK